MHVRECEDIQVHVCCETKEKAKPSVINFFNIVFCEKPVTV